MFKRHALLALFLGSIASMALMTQAITEDTD
jgi:hypothetical protein